MHRDALARPRLPSPVPKVPRVRWNEGSWRSFRAVRFGNSPGYALPWQPGPRWPKLALAAPDIAPGGPVPAPAPSRHDRMSMHNANKLKIGLFGSNCSSGRAVTLVPERWSGSWPDNLKLARLADEAGLDFLLPIGRWKGYG